VDNFYLRIQQQTKYLDISNNFNRKFINDLNTLINWGPSTWSLKALKSIVRDLYTAL